MGYFVRSHPSACDYGILKTMVLIHAKVAQSNRKIVNMKYRNVKPTGNFTRQNWYYSTLCLSNIITSRQHLIYPYHTPLCILRWSMFIGTQTSTIVAKDFVNFSRICIIVIAVGVTVSSKVILYKFGTSQKVSSANQ